MSSLNDKLLIDSILEEKNNDDSGKSGSDKVLECEEPKDFSFNNDHILEEGKVSLKI